MVLSLNVKTIVCRLQYGWIYQLSRDVLASYIFKHARIVITAAKVHQIQSTCFHQPTFGWQFQLAMSFSFLSFLLSSLSHICMVWHLCWWCILILTSNFSLWSVVISENDLEVLRFARELSVVPDAVSKCLSFHGHKLGGSCMGDAHHFMGSVCFCGCYQFCRKIDWGLLENYFVCLTSNSLILVVNELDVKQTKSISNKPFPKKIGNNQNNKPVYRPTHHMKSDTSLMS